MFHEADSFTKQISSFNDQKSIAQISANLCMYFHTTPFLVPFHWGIWSFLYFISSVKATAKISAACFFCQNLLLKIHYLPGNFV